MTTSTENDELSTNNTGDVKSLWKAISINDEMLFDEIANSKLIIDIIEEIFINDLLIESKILLENKLKINNMFVLLINKCVAKNYKNVSKIFLEFCEYFDLPYNKVFLLLHEKIQKLITLGLIKVIGKVNFKNLEKKYNPEKSQILSLFEMIKK